MAKWLMKYGYVSIFVVFLCCEYSYIAAHFLHSRLCYDNLICSLFVFPPFLVVISLPSLGCMLSNLHRHFLESSCVNAKTFNYFICMLGFSLAFSTLILQCIFCHCAYFLKLIA